MMLPVRLARRTFDWRHAVVGSALLVACAAGKPIEAGFVEFSLRLSPSSVVVEPGATVDFQAIAQFSDGSEGPADGATFQATGGTIDGDGVFRAGQSSGDYRVIASLGGRSDTSLVQITFSIRTLVGVRIDPSNAAVVPGGTQQFSAAGVLSDGTDSAVTVAWSATGGSVSPTGLFTAPAQTGSYLVTATVVGGTLSDTAEVLVAAVPPTLAAVILTPPSAALQFGQAQQFSALGQLSDGSTTSLSVTWTATGGTITSAGRYTAGSTAGTFRVIARAANGMADTSGVTISAPTIASLFVTPTSAPLQTGQIQQFNVSATLSNGATQANPAVTWSATGGTVTNGGLYTAGNQVGTFQVVATATNGVADTSVVTLSAASLTAITVTPSSVSLVVGQTQQFTATATLSNGGTQPNPTVVWSGTGGTINSSGFFTAGNAAGTFQVLASDPNGPLAGSATMQIADAPPPSMFFSSSESGCGTDSNVVLCDDFEDGTWYEKNCDQANGSGGLLQTDGWCGTIFNNAGLAGGTGRCGNVGFKSNCAATTGNKGSGGTSSTTGNMADHALAQGAGEIWVRFYTKPLAGYRFGQEKWLTFNADEPGSGGIRWGNLMWNCGGTTGSSGTMSMHFNPPMDICQKQNQGNDLDFVAGNWYFTEVHYRLNSPGQANGLFELWVDNCGPSGTTCPATPTLRLRRSDVQTDRASTSEQIRVLWFEAWSEPFSFGERYVDQIKVSKVGPIGFMP